MTKKETKDKKDKEKYMPKKAIDKKGYDQFKTFTKQTEAAQHRWTIPPEDTRGTATKRKTGMGHAKDYVDPIPNSPETRYRKSPICGAKRSGKSSSGPGICCNPAGYKTTHLGFGTCHRHQGNTPIGIMYAEKEKIFIMFKDHPILGDELDISPSEALLLEVRQTAGLVQWLRELIRSFAANAIEEERDPHRSLTQFTEKGVVPSVWITMYQSERTHLVAVCKAAISSGIEERRVRIVEEQGRQVAMVIKAIMNDPILALTPAQTIAAREVIRSHLLNVNVYELQPAQQEDDELEQILDADVVT